MSQKKDGANKDFTDKTPEEFMAEVLPDIEGPEVVGFEEASLQDVAANTGSSDSSNNNALSEELEKLKKEHLYLRAEYDNYRRQALKERSELLKYAGEKLARDLLDTLDIFETALSTEIKAENLETFVKGIEMTAQQLRGTLNKHGIQEQPAQGQAFDPNIHEALASVPTDEIPEGHIAQVYKKPYKYHDRILRPGQVVVAKPKES